MSVDLVHMAQQKCFCKDLVYGNYRGYVQGLNLDLRDSCCTIIFFGIFLVGCIRIISSRNVVVTRIISFMPLQE